MDFDEYEYLENMVENPETKKLEDKVSGGDEKVGHEEKDRSRSSKHRSDDDGDDFDRHSKRSRSRRESHDLEKDRSSRLEPSSRDKEKGEREKHMSSREHRHRDREDGSGKERNRDKDQDREGQRERGSDKKRDDNREKRDRETERERKGDEEKDRSRRSRSHSERHQHERGRESRGMESIDKDFKERRKDRDSANGNRETRKYKEKKDDGTQPEADPERDQRTVFAYQISLKASERDVYEFFSMAGKVRDVQLIMDRNSRRSKGVGYIEFYDAMSVPMAIALSGQLLLGLPVMVKPSEAEKNLVQPTPVVSGGLGPYSVGARKLYVGNLPVTIKEDQLRQVFESFGTVELVQMPSDPGTGTCKGFAFVQFARLEDAKAAQNLNGQLEIAGRVIKVSAITDQAGMQEAGVNLADLDDDEGSGLTLNAQSRALLMQKLDRTGAASSITGSSVLGQPSIPVLMAGLSVPAFAGPSIDPVGAPTECLLLKNMFDPSAEAEPGFDMDIKEDVQDECSKFGLLKHIHVEKHSAGFVYLRFENTESAVAAQRALHGRWFAGKMITATFMLPHEYEGKFPNSS